MHQPGEDIAAHVVAAEQEAVVLHRIVADFDLADLAGGCRLQHEVHGVRLRQRPLVGADGAGEQEQDPG